uniref:Placental growth factor b n=1 Tax=Salarias fasciatus TaxID=181472 RepID=A0A672G1U2_SALFA
CWLNTPAPLMHLQVVWEQLRVMGIFALHFQKKIQFVFVILGSKKTKILLLVCQLVCGLVSSGIVHSEYPTEVEHIYSPSCVPLVRCAGCCGDENLECHPTQTTNVTMQVKTGTPMTFVEHQTCECSQIPAMKKYDCNLDYPLGMFKEFLK